MAHLKGPWELSSGGIWAISPWNARVRIADLGHFSPMNGIDQDANGKMLAAAPEMYDALQKLVTLNVQYAIDRFGNAAEAETMACVIVARAAMAKAVP